MLPFVERENGAALRFPVAYGFSGVALQFLIECGICGSSLLYTLTGSVIVSVGALGVITFFK